MVEAQTSTRNYQNKENLSKSVVVIEFTSVFGSLNSAVWFSRIVLCLSLSLTALVLDMKEDEFKERSENVDDLNALFVCEDKLPSSPKD